MWIEMKTYSIQNGEDIDTLLLDNMNESNNAFELYKKDIQQYNKNTIDGEDSIMLTAILTPLEIQNTNSSKTLLKKPSKTYLIDFTNVKNHNGEYFSSIIDHLYENDRIFIFNGVVLHQFTTSNPNLLTILVQPQNNSSVILFKSNDSLASIPILEKNLSLLTGSGVYSIFGNIQRIVNCGEKFMSLTLLSCDKSIIKTLKYHNYFSAFENAVDNNQTASLVNYNFSSKTVDILVITPSNDFTSLSLNQRICLNNVKVKNVKDSEIFLLFVNGYSENIKAIPMENGISNSLRLPSRNCPVSDELKPEICYCKFKKLSSDVQLVLKHSIQDPSRKKREISPSSGSQDSFSFFEIQPNLFNLETQSRLLRFNTQNKPSYRINTCRLIYTEPNIFGDDDIVSGYCIKCSAFIQKRFLIETTQSPNVVYNCPKCLSNVHITFFFVMNFLYGNYESKCIQVYCFDKKAERIIKRISRKGIKLKNYLSHPKYRYQVKSSLKSLIRNKTSVCITFCTTPGDNRKVLLQLKIKNDVPRIEH